MNIPERQITRQNVESLATFVEQAVAAGSQASLLTFMFTNLNVCAAGPVAEMRDAIERFYRAFVTRAVREPKAPRNHGRLPVLLAAIDFPVASRRQSGPYEITLNDGRHAHAVLLLRLGSRLHTTADDHVRGHLDFYLADQRLMRVDARPIRHSPGRVLSYCFKSILRGRVSYDQGSIILPRARSELR